MTSTAHETAATLSMHITMDPDFDLHAAGLPPNEADAMFDAWADAVDQIAEGLGVNITIARVTVNSPEDRPTKTSDLEGAPLETAIWQLAHDTIKRNEDGSWRCGVVDPRRIVGLQLQIPA